MFKFYLLYIILLFLPSCSIHYQIEQIKANEIGKQQTNNLFYDVECYDYNISYIELEKKCKCKIAESLQKINIKYYTILNHWSNERKITSYFNNGIYNYYSLGRDNGFATNTSFLKPITKVMKTIRMQIMTIDELDLKRQTSYVSVDDYFDKKQNQ